MKKHKNQAVQSQERPAQLYSETSGDNQKLLGLELFRFICAFAVLVYHYQHFAYVGHRAENFRPFDQPFYPSLSYFYDVGYYGVQLFWCISGFIFFWKYQKKIANKSISFRQFAVNRISRLYPLHFITLLMVAVLQILYFASNNNYFVSEANDWYHFSLQLFLASNWIEQQGSFNVPIWSVSVEIIAYLLFFFCARIIASSLWINILIIIICMFLKYKNIDLKVIDCIMYFYAGGIMGLVSKNCNAEAKTHDNLQLWILTFLGIMASLYLFFGIYEMRNSQGLFILFMVPPFLFAIANARVEARPLARAIEELGGMTYGIYLLHFPLQLTFVLLCMLCGTEVPWRSPWLLIGYIVFTLVISRVIFHKFEMPVQKSLRRLMLQKQYKNREVA